jgi:hypothetical protein
MPHAATPAIALRGSPEWIKHLTPLLDENDFQPLPYTGHDPAHYIRWLVDHHVALALVDGDSKDWHPWVTEPKTDQATRRIPVLVTASRPDTESAAQEAGADDHPHTRGSTHTRSNSHQPTQPPVPGAAPTPRTASCREVQQRRILCPT